MRRCFGLLLLLTGVTAAWAAAPPVKGSGRFAQEQIAWLNKALREINSRIEAGRFEDAEKLAGERLALCQRVLGQDHWQTQNERLLVEQLQRLTKVPAQKR